MSLVTAEDCEFLTDRWGEIHDDNLPPRAMRIVERLRDSCMYEETTFCVERGGTVGILIEIELTTPPEDDAAEVLASWGRAMTEEDVRADAIKRAEATGRAFPGATVYATQHSGNFLNRVTLRAFLPHNKCSVDSVKRIADAMLNDAYGSDVAA